MTAYLSSGTVNFSAAAGVNTATIRYTLSPGSFEIRILSIEYGLQSVGTSGTNYLAVSRPLLNRYSAGSASGGSAITPVALRQGSAAASASSRFGTGVSVSGTSVYIVNLPPISVSNYFSVSDPAAVTYQFPVDLTVAPGSVFSIEGLVGAGGDGTISGFVRMNIYFEELRLTWPY